MPDYDDFKAPPPTDGLKQLSLLAADLTEAETEVAKAKDVLEKATAAVSLIAEKNIPALMDTLEIEEFITKGGLKITIKSTIRASIPAAKKATAMAWLDDNGHGGMVKRTVVIGFSRDEEEAAKKLRIDLEKQFENVAEDRKVEPSTLRAFIADQLANGHEVPMTLFGAWEQRIARVKSVSKKP